MRKFMRQAMYFIIIIMLLCHCFQLLDKKIRKFYTTRHIIIIMDAQSLKLI